MLAILLCTKDNGNYKSVLNTSSPSAPMKPASKCVQPSFKQTQIQTLN